MIALTPDQSVADSAVLMARSGISRVPVVDPADRTRPVGILSRTDILRAYPTPAEME